MANLLEWRKHLKWDRHPVDQTRRTKSMSSQKKRKHNYCQRIFCGFQTLTIWEGATQSHKQNCRGYFQRQHLQIVPNNFKSRYIASHHSSYMMQILTCCLQNGEANGDEEGESKEGVIEQEVRTSRPLKQRVNPHLKLYVLHISCLIFSSF